MKKNAGKKKEYHVGIDMGTRFIKALELITDGNSYKIVKIRTAEVEFPPTDEKLESSLKSLVEAFRPSTHEVNISFSSPHAVVRFVTMPKMKEEDLKSSLMFEAEKYIPFNIKEVVTDASILGYTTEDKRQMRVLFAAVKKKVVDQRVSMLKNAGLVPSIIDIDNFACFNAFLNSFENLDQAKSIAVINLGYSQANLLISQGASPFFTRDVQVGAREIAKAISGKLGIDRKESDRYIIDAKGKDGEVFDAAKPILNTLIDEIRLSFGYYENQYGKSVNEIYISGGMARSRDIAKCFEDSFDVKTTLWNPFGRLSVGSEVDAKLLESSRLQFAVCTGLALRG